jgi:hypothetical protein
MFWRRSRRKFVIFHEADINYKKRCAKRFAGIED